MSTTENASSPATAEIHFDFESETALSSSYILPPLYLPAKNRVLEKKIPTFNTEMLTFENYKPTGDENADKCCICFELVSERYTGCRCKGNYCRDCINACLVGGVALCACCRNADYLPTPRKTVRIERKMIPTHLTKEMIGKYRKETNILEKIKINDDYYRNEIEGVSFENLNLKQRIYLNLLQYLATDILAYETEQYEEEEISKRFYIADYNGNNLQDLNPTNIEREDYTLIENSYEIIYRNTRRYDSYNIETITYETYYDRLTDQLYDNPFEFPKNFIYDRCLKKQFKDCLDYNGQIFEAIYEECNEAFLKEIMADDLTGIMKDYHHELVDRDMIEQIMGCDFVIETFINYLGEDGQTHRTDIVLLVDHNSPL